MCACLDSQLLHCMSLPVSRPQSLRYQPFVCNLDVLAILFCMFPWLISHGVECPGVGVVHVLQALLYLFWGRSKRFFTSSELCFVLCIGRIPSVFCASAYAFA
jgi:hypothetical protein